MPRDNYHEPPPMDEQPPDPPPPPPPPPAEQRSMATALMTLTCEVCGNVFYCRTLETGRVFCSAVCRYAKPEEAARLRERGDRRRLEAEALRRVLEREIALMAKEEAGR